MTPAYEHIDSTSISAEDQEREAYLNEVMQRSTQFGSGNWQYEATYDFNDE